MNARVPFDGLFDTSWSWISYLRKHELQLLHISIVVRFTFFIIGILKGSSSGCLLRIAEKLKKGQVLPGVRKTSSLISLLFRKLESRCDFRINKCYVVSLMTIVKINSRFWIKRSALEDLLPLLQDVRLHGGFKARVLQEYFKGTLGMSTGCIEYLKCVCEVGLRVNISRAFGFYF